MLTAGLIGLPMVGKTTIFNLVTATGSEMSTYPSGRTGINVGVARVPDRRVDFLSRLYRPRKTTYASIQFSDVPGLVPAGQERGGVNYFLDGVRGCDLLVHVVRAFRNPDVMHVEGSVSPARDVDIVNLALLLADLDLVEKRIGRIEGGKKITREKAAELEVLKKCLTALENEIPLRYLEFTGEERALLASYDFLTEKPVVLVINTDEDQFRAGEYPEKARVEEMARERGYQVLEISGQVEMEISQLAEEDRGIFLEDMGLKEPGIDRLARVAYSALGLISFFTVGSDEVKAWTVRRGTSARHAAGKIHTDMERGFIRAEVVSFADLERCGSMARAREKGLVRLEGKDYVVEDGDILNIRFNV